MSAVRRLVMLFTLGALAATTLSAQQVAKPKVGVPGQWQLIGRTQADHGADHRVVRAAPST